MDLVVAGLAGLAMFCLVLGFSPLEPGRPLGALVALLARSVDRYDGRLRAARISVDPWRFVLLRWLSPLVLAAIGLAIGSPMVALLGGAAGFYVPGLYLDALVRAQRRRAEAEAPRLLQTMVASLTAGRTYLETLEEARSRSRDRCLREDLDHIVQQFYLDTAIDRSLIEVRGRSGGRNLRLIWDNLSICIANRIPASKAKGLFIELAAAVQFNVQVQQEVRSGTAGHRAQIWLLAAIVPGLFLYLRLINPEFFEILDTTFVGRFVLLPVAVGLEVGGILLSVRLARLEV